MRRPYLLELAEEGALVLPPAPLLHPLLDHPVQDGGHSIGAHPLQQIQPAAADTETRSRVWGSKCTSKSRESNHLKFFSPRTLNRRRPSS